MLEIEINSDRLVDNFIKLAKINSEYWNERELGEYIVSFLDNLGFDVKKLELPKELESNGFNIYARLDGKLEGNCVYACHMDTVRPGANVNPIVSGDIIKSDGTTILGADGKAGIAVVLEAVTHILEQKMDHKTIELIFTVDEYSGLNGAKVYDYSLIQGKDILFFDAGGPIGTIINQANGNYIFDYTILGQDAHAGLVPEAGINALVVAYRALADVNVGRLDNDMTYNIGIISGGKSRSTVVSDITIKGEVRAFKQSKMVKQIDFVTEKFQETCDKFGAELIYSSKEVYKSFFIEGKSSFVKDISKSFQSIRINPYVLSTGGGSDACAFFQHGFNTLLVSTGMTNVHKLNEYIKISDMSKATQFVIAHTIRAN